MKLLLIFGNGFDLNLGMPTSYRHFLKYFMDSSAYDNSENIIKLKSLINKDYDKWADFEVALGEVSSQFDDSDSYIDAVENVSQALTIYLSEIDKRFEPNPNIVMKFFKDIESFEGYFDLKQQHLWSHFGESRQIDTKKWEYDIMTFNYTSSLEKILRMAVGDLGANVSSIKNIEHIHMTLKEGLLMGVNDESQIANRYFQSSYPVKSTVVKPFVNREFDDGVDAKCRKMINGADVILLFGVSLGKTDADWWNYIGKALLNTNKILVYCPFDTEHHLQQKTQILRRNHEFSMKVRAALMSKDIDVLAPMGEILPIRENRMFDFGIDHSTLDVNFQLVYQDLLTSEPIKTTSFPTR